MQHMMPLHKLIVNASLRPPLAHQDCQHAIVADGAALLAVLEVAFPLRQALTVSTPFRPVCMQVSRVEEAQSAVSGGKSAVRAAYAAGWLAQFAVAEFPQVAPAALAVAVDQMLLPMRQPTSVRLVRSYQACSGTLLMPLRGGRDRATAPRSIRAGWKSVHNISSTTRRASSPLCWRRDALFHGSCPGALPINA